MTTEREPGPVWASFEAWAGSGARKARGFTQDQRDMARAAWNARDAEVDALSDERDALLTDNQRLRRYVVVLDEELSRQRQQHIRWMNRRYTLHAAACERYDERVEQIEAENQALRARLAEMEGAAHAVWDVESQSGDAIAAWTRLIDVLDGSAER